MKFRKLGQVSLALLVSLGLIYGVTSCTTDYTIGYLYVTGTSQAATGAGQVSGYKIANNTGKLTPIALSPFSSGGVNPRRELVAASGLFLYVLNGGDSTGQSSNVTLFTIGGAGTLNFQSSFNSQGSFPLAISTDSSGSFMFVLDRYSPSTSTPCIDSLGVAHPTGDITAFRIDGATGRLELILNQQLKDANGNQLTYFPVGCFPIDFKAASSNLYTIEAGTAATNDLQSVFVYSVGSTTGQLTLTQNVPLPTGAANLTAIGSGSSYVYLFDAGLNPGATGNFSFVLPYTPGTNGVLQAVTGGAIQQDASAQDPTAMLVDNTGKHIYVTNAGPSPGTTSPNSVITGYNILTTGLLQPTGGSPFGSPFVAGSGARCILEDPSNQYLYIANFNSSTVNGYVINSQSGNLDAPHGAPSYSTTGNPTWCVASNRPQ
jgi:6-phosphogluconolactonase (cycloisomerase 2 family)